MSFLARSINKRRMALCVSHVTRLSCSLCVTSRLKISPWWVIKWITAILGNHLEDSCQPFSYFKLLWTEVFLCQLTHRQRSSSKTQEGASVQGAMYVASRGIERPGQDQMHLEPKSPGGLPSSSQLGCWAWQMPWETQSASDELI